MFDPEEGAVPGDSASQDASTPGFLKQFNDWRGKPENSSALLQFGLAMLQPRAAGQSAIGQAANAVAEAGGAVGRVQAQDKADTLQEENIADKHSQRDIQNYNAESGRINANAYQEGIRTKGIGGTNAAVKAQARFNIWKSTREPVMDPLSPTGAPADPIVGAMQRRFPDIKSKADILANEQYMREARKIFSAGEDGAAGDEGDEEGNPAAPSAQRAAPTGTYPKFNWQGKTIQYDPSKAGYVDQAGNVVYKPEKK